MDLLRKKPRSTNPVVLKLRGDYANTKWDRYGYLHILMAGGFNTEDHQQGSVYYELLSLCWHLGIGSLQNTTQGLSIIAAADNKIWSERDGVKFGTSWSLERKWGSK